MSTPRPEGSTHADGVPRATADDLFDDGQLTY